MIEKNDSINIYTNKKYIFMYYTGVDATFCWTCYRERLIELDQYSKYFEWHIDQPNNIEFELIEALTRKLLKENKGLLYEINRDTLEIKLRSTFRRGECSCNDNIDVSVPEDYVTFFDSKNNRQVSFETVIEKIESSRHSVYDSQTSIINSLTRSGDSYGTPMVQTEVFHRGISMLSYGRTTSYEKSKYISILESLERYATAFPYINKDIRLKEGESDKIDLTLSEIMQQCDYSNRNEYTKDEFINYEEVRALHTGRQVLIPEQLVYYNSHAVSGEKRYIYESSNGSALGSTESEASLHALLELIERDAFLATWYGQIPPIRIKNETIQSKSIHAHLESLKRKDIRVHLFDISMEINIPTVWILLEKIKPKKNEMAFYTSAAASFDLEESIERALIEGTTAITVFTNVFDNQEYRKRKDVLLDNPDSVHRLEDHLLLYSNIEMKKTFSFALETDFEQSYDSLVLSYANYQGDFSKVVQELEEQIVKISSKAYRATIYNPNLFSAGFVNVKYIVPGMLTMTFGQQNKRVVRSRIEKAINFKKRGNIDIDWINKIPHPFP